MKTKKHLFGYMGILLTLVCTLSVLCASGMAYESRPEPIEPRYSGISTLSAAIDITPNGLSSSYGRVKVLSSYTADMLVELQRDGSTIKSWSKSGTGELEIAKDYWVTSGHDYQVVVSVTVKNSSGKIVDTPSTSSSVFHY